MRALLVVSFAPIVLLCSVILARFNYIVNIFFISNVFFDSANDRCAKRTRLKGLTFPINSLLIIWWTQCSDCHVHGMFRSHQTNRSRTHVNEFALWCSHFIKWNCFRMPWNLSTTTLQCNFFDACGFGLAKSSLTCSWSCYFEKRVRVAYFAGSFLYFFSVLILRWFY